MENQEVQLLKDYSDTEKGAYLGAIASIASADRDASEQEIKFLAALSESAGLSQESTRAVLSAAHDPANLSVQKCLDVLKGSDLRYSFITDIMSFAKADGHLSGEEEELIKGMADYLGVNQQQYGVLKEFVNVADESAKKGEIVEAHALGASSESTGGGMGDMLKKAGIPADGLMKGVLAVAAPILIASILRGGSRRGGMMGGMGGMGGGLLGGGLLGGLLGSVMSGGMNRGGMMGGGMGSGGLGSVLGGLGGLFGGGRGGMMGGGGMGGSILGGGMGSILSNVLGGRRARW
ncbi:TerB family tellurite resistance protein [Adhaeribacter soli]|uniref:TerB family tellurite resistance protein n=1 Tax=Adhaeribacter soli TaxID=2607655 RepID=A0A5N1IPK9_9BACT|nr:TerB family tellurite resistance protein [Adhaeribacter soli]KAA9331817.1 TerB family tellurite resistance protein [Adhaeribacter soli]